MDKSKLSFLLEGIHSLAFVNPFAEQRDEIEGNIIRQMGRTEKALDKKLKVYQRV